MVTGHLTDRMGSGPILPVTTDTMVNFDGHGDGVGTCKQILEL